MSPDTRHHRGAHPADAELFHAYQLPKLRQAVRELSWLLSRSYQMTSALKLVGDRHGLRERQRLAVLRSSCSDESKERRRATLLPMNELNGQNVVVDGFNLIITIEAALSRGPLLRGADLCIRDLSSVHGSYRSVHETEHAINIIGEALQSMGVSSVFWLLDRPVSNSGRLASKIADLATRSGWPWKVDVVFNPDAMMMSSADVAITSDATVLDHVSRWTDLKSHLINRIGDAWLIDLSN
ncbi:MAG: DUF434 domain-containing protein [Blastocatellia bacterium]|nr:MAG: DUF434 domain-containing protein [Blastocatellia bacterium]